MQEINPGGKEGEEEKERVRNVVYLFHACLQVQAIPYPEGDIINLTLLTVDQRNNSNWILYPFDKLNVFFSISVGMKEERMRVKARQWWIPTVLQRDVDEGDDNDTCGTLCTSFHVVTY